MNRLCATALIALFAFLLALAPGAFAQGEITLSYMVWAPIAEEQESIRETIRLFEAEFPGVKVDLLLAANSNEVRERVVVMHAAGTAPDVMVLGRWDQWEFWTNGLIQPLTEWVERDAALNYPDIVNHDQLIMDGQVIGLPHHGGGQQLAFHIDLVEGAGLERPDAQYAAGRWTISALEEAARAITRDINGDGQNDIFGIGNLHGGFPFMSLLRVFGTTLMHPETGLPQVNTPEGLETIRWIEKLVVQDRVSGGNENQGTQGLFNMCPRCVFTRSQGFYSFPVNIAPYPKHEVGHRTVGGHNFFAVSSQTRHAELAQEFIKFNLSPEMTLKRLENGEIIEPVRYSTFREPLFFERFGNMNLDVHVKSSSEYMFPPETVKVPGVREARTVATQEMQRLFQGEQSAEQTAFRIDDRIVREILTGL